MKSDLFPRIRQRLLPKKGAEFELTYFGEDQVPVKYGERPYSWVSAISEGLRVICHGPMFRVSHARQKKPMLPDEFNGEDGCYRRALRIAINGDETGMNADYYIHILGDLIVVGTERIHVADMVSQASLTVEDQELIERLRRG
jgi:hypothetical protein